MAINFNQLFMGQPLRTTNAVDKGQSSERSENETGPVSEPDSPKGGRVAHTLGVAGPNGGLEAMAIKEVDPAIIPRAVKQANSLAETALRSQQRSVEFTYREESDRVVMTIREEVDGEEVVREIPPQQFLELIDKLQNLSDTKETPRGTLLSIDA
jgi:hypothetical protein